MRDSQAAGAGSNTKHAERDSEEPADRQHDAGEKDGDSGQRRRRERGEDEVAEQEGPGLYMDAINDTAVKRRARSPLKTYRPPIALQSKKERSRVSGSVLDRLGTASASEPVTNPYPSRIPFHCAIDVYRAFRVLVCIDA